MKENLKNLTVKELKQLLKKTKALKAQYHNKQMAMKILLNSGYGAMANKYFRWFDNALAESITLSGQLSVRWVAKYINEFLNNELETDDVDYIIAIDTDSNYLNLDPIVQKHFSHIEENRDIAIELDKYCKNKIQPVINKAFDDLFNQMNAFEHTMEMKREAISEAGVWVAKKRYCLSVWDMEGTLYDTPKIKMTGIEAVRSSTPEICRDWIKKAIPLITTRDRKGLMDFIAECEQEFKGMPFEKIAFPRGVSDIPKYYSPTDIYIKGTPIGARAALLYNHLIKEMKLTNLYRPIQSGDKMRFCYLKLPNPAKENVIGCPDELPEEFELEEYIDYDLQFEKAFYKPLVNIINAAQISTETTIDIAGFFE